MKPRNYLERLSHKIDHIPHSNFIAMVVGILILNSALFLFLNAILFDPQVHWEGAQGYGKIAENLVSTGVYTANTAGPTAARPPVYPLFLAGIRALFGPTSWPQPAIYVQAVLLALCGWTAINLAMDLFKNRLAGLAVCMLFITHIHFNLEALAQRETLLYTLLLLFFFRIIYSPSQRGTSALALGTLAGLSYLTRPTGIILIFFCGLFSWQIWNHFGFKKALQQAILCAIAILTMIAPWQFYVYRNFNTFTFRPSSNAGENLYKGNTPHLVGIYPWVDVDLINPHIKEKLIQAGITGQLERDQFLKREAAHHIKENPKQFLLSALIKTGALYSPLRTPFGSGKLEIEEGRYVLHDFKFYPFFFACIPHITLLLLGGIFFGFATFKPSPEIKRFACYTGGYFLLVTLLHILTFGETRFRLPMDMLLIIMTAGWLTLRANNTPSA